VSADHQAFEFRSQPWMADAKCAGLDPELFYPQRGESTPEAKAVCMTCPVRAQCLDYALSINERQGIWGGTSERQRAKIRVHWEGDRRRHRPKAERASGAGDSDSATA
jgi:WhiB family transcriptional regulator, redox-sensing transcriptional regulator